ncbi:ead/Ea22-like family protein [Escherichia coli]|uniref:ead/Ea22-like family protein n=1 Tax=Escherichia coli TaxID=562 RepID=UPI003B5BB734
MQLFSGRQPVSKIDYQALREAAEAIKIAATPQKLLAFRMKVTPQVVLALLDELERNQQYIKRRDQENEEIALTVGKLRVELEAAEKRIAELEAREIKPAKGEVLVVVSGFTGCGKSAIAGEIEIAMKAIGVPVKWTNGDAEKRMTGADWLTAIEMYKPTVRIVEVNVPRAAGIRIKGEEHANKTRR